MKPPRIRTRSGRNSRARFNASWSPARKLGSRRFWIRLGAIAAGMVVILTITGNVYASSFIDSLPNVHGLDASALTGDTIITDRNGVVLADIGNQGDQRTYVPYNNISPKIVEATVAIEDRTFWTNPGFDSAAILRTATHNFRAGGITGGASTISQQVAKQLFLTPQQTLNRKIQEIVLAYQLNQAYSKKQIMELYLNRSPYGEQQYGVGSASKTYFGKAAGDVDWAQAAMLAGIPQSPEIYSPVTHFDYAKARQKEVLDALVATGKLSQAQANTAYAENLQPVGTPTNNWKAPLFVQHVLSELRSLGFSPGQQQLSVKTTLDYGKQQMAEGVIRDNLNAQKSKDSQGQLNSSLVSVNPQNGEIIAYVGNALDYSNAGKNSATIDFVTTPRNPGSSVKMFTYGKALLDRKVTMDTTIFDGPVPYVVTDPNTGGKSEFRNFVPTKGYGNQPVKVTLPNSLNISAVKVEEAVGVPALVDFYRTMGMNPRVGNPCFTSTKASCSATASQPYLPLDTADTNYGPSLTLGGYPITMLEEVSALATYGDMGLYHQPEAIIQVTDPRGTTLYTEDPKKYERQAVDAGVAYIIGAILSNDANRQLVFGMGTALHMNDHRSAAKTGTTENYKDGLTIGFTPDLATVVWIGDVLDLTLNGDGSYKYAFHGSQADGVFVAAPAWHSFMEKALQGVDPNKWYTMPSDVKQQGGDYFLSDATKINNLQGDAPSPSPSNVDNGIPADPGTGPVKVGNGGVICVIGNLPPGCTQPAPGPTPTH